MTPEERWYAALMDDEGAPAVLPPRPAWMARAACRGSGVTFVPSSPHTEANAADAKALCDRCSCRPECLAYALDDTELLGVWAGTTTAERRQMRREAKRAS